MAGLDGPLQRRIAGSRALPEVDVHNRVLRRAPARLGRAGGRPIRDRLSPGPEHDDLPLHLGVAEPAELRALDRVGPGDVRADPEAVRDPGDRVDLDAKVRDVQRVYDLSGMDPQQDQPAL